MSSQIGIEKLRQFEKENTYVFHGTPQEVAVFEVRQAVTYIKDIPVLDGVPAIYASPFLNYAIFKAIINRKNCPNGFRASTNGKIFYASQTTISQLHESSSGYVYVFKKSDFEKSERVEEYKAYVPTKPLHVFLVTKKDMAFEIKKF